MSSVSPEEFIFTRIVGVNWEWTECCGSPPDEGQSSRHEQRYEE